MDADLNLVDFAKPPVEEVSFAVQFVDPVITFDVLGDIRAMTRERLPQHQTVPMVPRMEERFDEVAGVRFAMPWGTERPLNWFLSDDGHWLLQVQEDRIAFNWRRQGQPDDYPRYPALRELFIGYLELAFDAIGRAGTGTTIDVCELTYINELSTPLRGDPPRADLRDALVTIAGHHTEGFLGAPEDTQWAAKWLIVLDGEPAGRLYSSAQSARRATDLKPVHVLNMTARIVRSSDTVEDIIDAFDVGHEWIVRGFADLTTAQMHETWERKR